MESFSNKLSALYSMRVHRGDHFPELMASTLFERRCLQYASLHQYSGFWAALAADLLLGFFGPGFCKDVISAMQRRDAMQVLQVNENATPTDVRKAYLRLALQSHPGMMPWRRMSPAAPRRQGWDR